MPWRRRCSPSALAVQVAYDAPPLMSILCSSGGFSERQLQSVAVLLDVVYPLLPWSSLRSTSGNVHEGGCVMCGYLSSSSVSISPAAYEKMCTKYVSFRFWSSSTTSSSMSNTFIMSIFLFRSLLVTPQILLSASGPYHWYTCWRDTDRPSRRLKSGRLKVQRQNIKAFRLSSDGLKIKIKPIRQSVTRRSSHGSLSEYVDAEERHDRSMIKEPILQMMHMLMQRQRGCCCYRRRLLKTSARLPLPFSHSSTFSFPAFSLFPSLPRATVKVSK